MDITPIPDKEAAELLSISYSTIRNAVKRGDLTRFPRPGLVQHVVKEQVLLFHGKTQLKFAALSKEERKIWDEIDEQVNSTTSTSQQEQERGRNTSKERYIETVLFFVDKALKGEVQLSRTRFKENLASRMTEGDLNSLTTLLEMLEIAANNHTEDIVMDMVNRILKPLHNASEQIFLEVLVNIIAILQEHECLHEMTAIKELLSVA
jgi:predicted site-specific integrase-resolvase